eukprot:CAMPEP_0202912328 /NCGR_PEP_ID=MMETSP1392-20130828/57454_1 /ASSEMBLY_ACC=CAM_ASM_000868 /TAXON_ID=225041 /ORGANISM="Chlamydomonas chlamydogama, Strain SAG 11-48b" /LENGTH=95 /DNA_ID=CAMNT_0049603195 /DNA_START=1272 /DNA_END=1559 /DNA_ORIENTATION=-
MVFVTQIFPADPPAVISAGAWLSSKGDQRSSPRGPAAHATAHVLGLPHATAAPHDLLPRQPVLKTSTWFSDSPRHLLASSLSGPTTSPYRAPSIH